MRTLFQRGPKRYSRETKFLLTLSNIGRMDANAFFVPEVYNIGNALRIVPATWYCNSREGLRQTPLNNPNALRDTEHATH
jgi:hypothetical protein